MPAASTGPNTLRIGPMFGTICRAPPSTAQNAAHGTFSKESPTHHMRPTAIESWNWAIAQFFSAPPVMRACSVRLMMFWMLPPRRRGEFRLAVNLSAGNFVHTNNSKHQDYGDSTDFRAGRRGTKYHG